MEEERKEYNGMEGQIARILEMLQKAVHGTPEYKEMLSQMLSAIDCCGKLVSYKQIMDQLSLMSELNN